MVQWQTEKQAEESFGKKNKEQRNGCGHGQGKTFLYNMAATMQNGEILGKN